jgi:uncharacterized protein DUF1566
MHIEKVKISAAGEAMPADANDHVAVLLPQFGLMFTAKPVSEDDATQDDLVKACASLTLAGFSDWRLPEIDELQLIIDRTRRAPAFDPAFFHAIPNDWIWSSTAVAGSPSSAWYVSASSGYVGSNRRYGAGFALAVRAAGSIA